MERHILVDNLLHPLANALHIVLHKRLTVALLEVAVVTTGQRMLDEELAAGEDVAGGLVEHEAQRADIHTVAGALTCIEELHVAVLVQPELQSLRSVVHLCRHHREGHLQFRCKSLIDLQQRRAFGKTLALVIILAADLKHRALEC